VNRFKMSVLYDDGTSAVVGAGQREMAAWEAEPFGCASFAAMDVKPVTFLRYLAWASLRRAAAGFCDGGGKFPTFEKWSATVDEVSDYQEEEEEDAAAAEAAGPTRPDQPAEG
jgi:hypothetical protein